MWIKWFPWKFVLKRVARAQGFVDPILILSRFNRFAQPSEVLAPVELLRAGAVMHSRGLINSQVIQHNLDWVWPYWAERQFDPRDPSFIPRAFSITHINLTHRNWTAVGIPGCAELPLVDPRGLVMPYFDSWSIDLWLQSSGDEKLISSRASGVHQRVDYENGFNITTSFEQGDLKLISKVEMSLKNGIPYCRIEGDGFCKDGGFLVVVLRPYNPEGISFIHEVEMMQSGTGWLINGKDRVFFDRTPQKYRFSQYTTGDVYHWLGCSLSERRRRVVCDVGMASAMVAFELNATDGKGHVAVEIPLGDCGRTFPLLQTAAKLWSESLADCAAVTLPHLRYDQLYSTALRTLVIHTPLDSYAGPYTYKRFWFRDAAFIVSALIYVGLKKRAKQVIERFFFRQNPSGYFLSQEGEWDSNGQALWAMEQYCTLFGVKPPEHWIDPVKRGCNWIIQKRHEAHPLSPIAGLMPSGFSAEHLGPNDHYYWDNFWSVAGLRAGASLLLRAGEAEAAQKFSLESEGYLQTIERSLKSTAGSMRRPAMPASPNRRLDSGAVGSLAAGYPLKLWDQTDERLLLTADYLFQNCLIDGAFYHDISHSGINPYLSLHIAQVLMRAGDKRCGSITDAVARLASSTGQWPEAIHPQLKTGCMGDGQHVWAAAEWVSVVRNSFFEEEREKLVLCRGIFPDFFQKTDELSFGPAPTAFGYCTVYVKRREEKKVEIRWSGEWFDKREPRIVIALSGREPVMVQEGLGRVVVEI